MAASTDEMTSHYCDVTTFYRLHWCLLSRQRTSRRLLGEPVNRSLISHKKARVWNMKQGRRCHCSILEEEAATVEGETRFSLMSNISHLSCLFFTRVCMLCSNAFTRVRVRVPPCTHTRTQASMHARTRKGTIVSFYRFYGVCVCGRAIYIL